MILLALDVGTKYTGFCFVDTDTYRPIAFDKVSNEDVMEYVKTSSYDILVYEEFESFGMSVGKDVLESIKWNGRYMQIALDLNKKVDYITRREEKMNLCHKVVGANDTTIKHALIDRFATFDYRAGKGTIKQQDFFYGFKADVWSAFAVGCTWIDKQVK